MVDVITSEEVNKCNILLAALAGVAVYFHICKYQWGSAKCTFEEFGGV